jgi:hypothetical protein
MTRLDILSLGISDRQDRGGACGVSKKSKGSTRGQHWKVVRAATKRAKEKETAGYLAAHPEVIREQNIATTRSWWGKE